MPTTTQALTGTTPITAAGVGAATPCTQEADIALANSPDLQVLMGCALGPALFNPVAINEFGPGPDFDRFMLWFSHELQIYVLRPDKSWQAYPDNWTINRPLPATPWMVKRLPRPYPVVASASFGAKKQVYKN